MYAFVRTDVGLFKVYRHEYDWQIIGPDFERWSSIMRALRRMPNPLRRKKHIMTTHRTEQERVAWISGDRDRAALLARIADLERLVDQLTDELIDLRESHDIERLDP